MQVKTTHLMLIRHGHTADNSLDNSSRLCGWHDPPLTARGRHQAAELAQWLRHRRPDALYTSTLARARQTADALAAVWGLDSRLEPDLREISCGAVDGWPLSAVQLAFPQLWRDNMTHAEYFAWPGGESYRAFRARILHAITTLARRYAGQHIALVTHAGVISQILGALHGTPAGRWDLWRPGNATLTRVHWHGERGDLVLFDEHVAEYPLPPPDCISATDDAQVIARRVGGISAGA